MSFVKTSDVEIKVLSEEELAEEKSKLAKDKKVEEECKDKEKLN